jgi:phosphonate transport system permease protein
MRPLSDLELRDLELRDLELRDLRARYGHLAAPSLAARVQTAAWLAGFAGLVVFSMIHLDISPTQLWDGLGKLGELAGVLFPPDDGGYLATFLKACLETLAMAFLGTLLAAVGALPLGFLAARNVVANKILHFLVRRVLDVVRGIDVLIWALVFVSAVGLGPFAGILAIAAHDLGVLSKLFSEAIENTERGQVEGVRAAGGNGWQIARFGLLPQVLPIFVSHILYFFESNIRSASILGIVGAGGIGLQLSDRIRVNAWAQVSFIVIMIIVLVAAIDTLSRAIRLRLIHGANPRRTRGASDAEN